MAVDFDIYNANYTEISRLVNGGLLRPLNHSYIPNINNVWPSFTNPWYDQEWRYTVPYTIYTTGIGWRTDQVPDDIGALKNPYDSLWDPKYKGKTAVIDDFHTAMAMVLLRQGITDVNTSSEADLKMVGEQLKALVEATSPKVTITMYNDLPAGQFGLAQMWSGDIINAQSYLPEGTGPEILRYWFPADGKGMVDNDMLVTLERRQEPGAGPPVPQPHARPRGGDAELLRDRLPAAAELDQAGFTCRRGVHPGEPALGDRETGVLRRRLPAAGARPGQRRRLAQRLAGLQGRRVLSPVAVPVIAAPSGQAAPRRANAASGLWAGAGRTRNHLAAAVFVFPLYVVLCIVFGQIDPLFRTPVPVWNPLQWDPTQFTYVLTHIVGENGVFGPALLRTARLRADRQRAVPAHRIPGRLLRRPAVAAGARACCWRC